MYSIMVGKFSSYFIYTAFIGRMNINHVPEIITRMHVYLELAHFCLFFFFFSSKSNIVLTIVHWPQLQSVCWFGQSKDRTE